MVTLEARTPCVLCGYLLASWTFPSARVNKRSIRITGPSINCGPLRECPECGTPSAYEVQTRYRLTAESVAEVEAYRAKRWPELAAALRGGAQQLERRVQAAGRLDRLAKLNGHHDRAGLAALSEGDAAPLEAHRRHDLGQVLPGVGDRHLLIVHARSVSEDLRNLQDVM